MAKIRACVKYDKHLETIDKTFDRNEILEVKLATIQLLPATKFEMNFKCQFDQRFINAKIIKVFNKD